VPGIEITAFVGETDVHVLAYFIDVRSDRLSTLLQSQRASRFNRVRKIVERLASYGISLDPDAILRPAADDAGKAPGRPWIARALVAAGHVRSADEAFSLWLAEGRPGFVARSGLAPRDVFTTIHDAGGIASLAHPGLVGHDEWIPSFAKEGLDAIEAYHSEHDPLTTSRYAAMARDLSLAVSGGSDYHGDHTHGVRAPGSVSLPRDAYDRLKALVR
jgi:predicted metal-dependent phosphoesterase TrpH